MGSKKKHDSDSSSSSSSDSDSDSSYEHKKKPKRTKKKHSRSSSEESPKRKPKETKPTREPAEEHDRRRRHTPDRESQRPHSSKLKHNPERRHERRDRSPDRHQRPERRDRPDHRTDHRSGGRDNRDRGRNFNRDRPNPRQDQRRRRRSNSFDHANAKWGRQDLDQKEGKKEPEEKEKPNFGLSGKLTEETNTYRGVVIKYSEPPEARKPRRRWRLYPFKGDKSLQTLYIHRESAYLIGRERKVVDLPVDHPSCSKQHAALQYRLVPFTRDDGSQGKRVRPYIIDLDSANGTFINEKKIEPRKYVELLEKDVIKFGFSSREYVLLHENSKDEAMDDDVKVEEEEAGGVPVKKEEPAD